MTTRNAGNQASVAKTHMENARRNVKMCERKEAGETGKAIATQYGLAASTVSVILQQGLEYWQGWERKAIDAGVLEEEQADVGPVPSGHRYEMIPITLIDPNPWQPRQQISDDVILERAQDIFRNGLLSPIQVRPVGERYQLVYGQYRLEAFWFWHNFAWDADEAGYPGIEDGGYQDDYWDYVTETTRIPAIVREMTDADVILASLAENSQREDLGWLDETWALKRALDADPSLSQRKLAATVKISPTNLSTRLSMLKLPEPILQLVDEGKLAWTTARELLGFVSQTHIHQEELEYLAKALPRSRVLKDGRPLTALAVREFMINAMGHENNGDKWEHLSTETNTIWIGNMTVAKHGPNFDVAPFIDSNFDHLHTLPGAWGHDTVTWTCRGQQWRAERDKAIEAKRKRDEAESARVAALQDPVMEHPEAKVIREFRDNVGPILPTKDEVRIRCSDNDGEHTWEPRHPTTTCRQFLCRQCGLTYERQSAPVGLQSSEPEPAQLQDMTMAAVPGIKSVPTGNTEVELSEDTFEALYALHEEMERFYADVDTPPTIESVNALAVKTERARNALLPYMQAPLVKVE